CCRWPASPPRGNAPARPRCSTRIPAPPPSGSRAAPPAAAPPATPGTAPGSAPTGPGASASAHRRWSPWPRAPACTPAGSWPMPGQGPLRAVALAVDRAADHVVRAGGGARGDPPAHVVGDEQGHPWHLDGPHHRAGRVVLEGDAAAEGGLDVLHVGGGG